MLPFAFFMARQSASLWLEVLWYEHHPSPLLCGWRDIYGDAADLADTVRPAAGSAVRSVALVVVAAARAWRGGGTCS